MNTIHWNNNAIEIIDENGIIWHRQPDWPDTTPWSSEAEARAWAQSLLDWLDDQQKPEADRLGVSAPMDGPA